MARQVIEELVDDYDGTSAAEETVSFALDGVTYEIDVSMANGDRLRNTLGQWTPFARTIDPSPRRTNPSAIAPEQIRIIRKWARAHGVRVSKRGPISAAVVEAYHNAAI
ncbi:histone-like nucleoid-structuring protein Lsr2 [Nocardia sp. NPDC055002]